MSDPQHVPPEVVKALPGTLGAIVSLAWVRGTWQQRLASFVGGTAASYYGTDAVTRAAGLDNGVSGFLVGLFAMACVGKAYEALAALDMRTRLDRLLRKWGL